MSTDREEERTCPLCLEELDVTDRNFNPCECGYRICLWCFHSINEKLNGKCPACRSTYKKDVLDSIDPKLVKAAEEETSRKKQESILDRKDPVIGSQKSQNQGSVDSTGSSTGRQVMVSLSPEKKAELQSMRIMQRNLVYVVGIPISIAKEDVLRQSEYFGGFGRIIKIAVNKKQAHAQSGSCSAYITYKRDQDAADAIAAVNGQPMEGMIVRATYGTTKYCSFFLRGVICNNPNCLYLHQLARESECFTKEDLAMSDRFGSSSKTKLPEHTYGQLRISPETNSMNPAESIPAISRMRSSKDIDTDEMHHKHKFHVDLPGLSSFGLGFSVFWTPAKSSPGLKVATGMRVQSIQSSNEQGVYETLPIPVYNQAQSNNPMPGELKILKRPELESAGHHYSHF